MIYLIERIWFDTLENEVGSAVGYKPVGYMETEKEAIKFCNKGGVRTKKDCWAIMGEIPAYRYKEIKKINE